MGISHFSKKKVCGKMRKITSMITIILLVLWFPVLALPANRPSLKGVTLPAIILPLPVNFDEKT